MTPQDELLIDKFIEHEVKRAAGRGHDRLTKHWQREEARKASLRFINTYWFDVYCLFLDYDPVFLRQSIYRAIMQKAPKEQIKIVFSEMECV